MNSSFFEVKNVSPEKPLFLAVNRPGAVLPGQSITSSSRPMRSSRERTKVLGFLPRHHLSRVGVLDLGDGEQVLHAVHPAHDVDAS